MVDMVQESTTGGRKNEKKNGKKESRKILAICRGHN